MDEKSTVEKAPEPEKGPKPEKPRNTTKRVPVTLVSREGKSVVVQYKDGGREVRVMVPAKAYEERMSADVLEAGISMSVPWADFLKPTVTGAMLEKALYHHGIWTKRDWQTKPRQVLSALRILTGDILGQIREAMLRYGGE